MKTARAMPSDLSSSRRAQPVRQTRINPPRVSGSLSRSFSGRDLSGGGLTNGHNDDDQTEIFPAITNFADAITALPRELVRHFTLLKEVDAKIFAPEEALGQLVDAALNCPLPERRHDIDHTHSRGPVSIPVSAPASVNGSLANGQNSIVSVPDDSSTFVLASAAWDPENVPRRQLFRQCAFTIQDLLVSLDEKNHVISTATEALQKQLSRINDCFPHIENEISDEARYGSTTHWAYAENRIHKPADRSRRDVASVNHLTNAANQVGADEAAARSEARKQAMLAKKGRHHVESDFDDHLDGRHRGDVQKKPHGNTKKGRPAEVGLGIINGGANGNPPPKRRRVDKGPNGGAVMERSLSSVYGNSSNVPKGKTNSPLEIAIPDASKKKSKAATAPNGHQRKRTALPSAMSPSIASSPIQSSFLESKNGPRASPVPTNGGRPTASRARQNSTQSIIESARQRPSSSASNKQNGSNTGQPDLTTVAHMTGRSMSEVKTSMKESANNANGEHMIEDAEQDDPDMRGGIVVGSKRENTLKQEDSEANGEAPTMSRTNSTTVMTKSGRASKPSTPAIPAFPDAVRSRSGRNALEQTANNKRSHKKGAGQAAQLIAAQNADDDATSSMLGDEDEAEGDGDEPTYCYCNGVSYGEMVACDNDACVKEWFHLECVGLKVAPKGNAKWYCDDCKENMKHSKRFNGR